MGWDWVKVLKEEMFDLSSDEHLSRHAATDRLAWVSSQAPARAPLPLDDWADHPNTPPRGALLGLDEPAPALVDDGSHDVRASSGPPPAGDPAPVNAPVDRQDVAPSEPARLPSLHDFDFAMPTSPPLEYPAAAAGVFGAPPPAASLLGAAGAPELPVVPASGAAAPSPAADPYAADRHAAQPYAAEPYAADPYAADPYAAAPSAAGRHAVDPFAAGPADPAAATVGYAYGATVPPAAPPVPTGHPAHLGVHAVAPGSGHAAFPSAPSVPSAAGTAFGMPPGSHEALQPSEQGYVLTLMVDGVLAGVALSGAGDVTVGRERQSTLVIPETKQTVSRRALTLTRTARRAVEARVENRNGAWVTRQLPEGTRQEFVERGNTVSLRVGDRLSLDPPGTVVVGLGDPN